MVNLIGHDVGIVYACDLMLEMFISSKVLKLVTRFESKVLGPVRSFAFTVSKTYLFLQVLVPDSRN